MNCCTLPASTGNFSPTTRQPLVPCLCRVKLPVRATAHLDFGHGRGQFKQIRIAKIIHRAEPR